MTEDDRPRFARMLVVLAETLAEPFSDARLEGYWLALRDLPLERYEAAVQSAMTDATFFPKPAELRKLAGVGAPDAGAVEAALMDHLRSLGGDRRMPADPFLRLVVERLGGLTACVDLGATRIRAIQGILPGLVTAAKVRGLAMPIEADHRPALEFVPRIEMREPELPRSGSGGMARLGEVTPDVLPRGDA